MQHRSPFLRLCLALFTIVNLSCRKDDLPVEPPQPNIPDTTSHNFTWQKFTFGDDGQVHALYDVAIQNDSDIWAVGDIYIGAKHCNALHWNGKEWEAKPVQFTDQFMGGNRYPNLRAVATLGPGKLLVTDGATGAWVEGNKVTMDTTLYWVMSGSVLKFFALSSKNIYAVGVHGSIIHYDGTKWGKMASGTTVILRDVYGTSDGKTVWASGYDTSSVLLKYDGSSWQKVWEYIPGPPLMPFYSLVSGVFATSTNLWVSGDAGIYKCPLSSDTSHIEKQWIDPIRASHAIRGTPTGSSIAVVYDDGIIWHYNGASWSQVHPMIYDDILYDVAVSKGMVVAVGTDFNNGKALIYLGKH